MKKINTFDFFHYFEYLWAFHWIRLLPKLVFVALNGISVYVNLLTECLKKQQPPTWKRKQLLDCHYFNRWKLISWSIWVVEKYVRIMPNLKRSCFSFFRLLISPSSCNLLSSAQQLVVFNKWIWYLLYLSNLNCKGVQPIIRSPVLEIENSCLYALYTIILPILFCKVFGPSTSIRLKVGLWYTLLFSKTCGAALASNAID